MSDRRYYRATDEDRERFIVVDSRTGEQLPAVFQVDTESGSVIQYVIGADGLVECTPFEHTEEGGLSRAIKMVLTMKNFDVIEKDTGTVLAEYRKPQVDFISAEVDDDFLPTED